MIKRFLPFCIQKHQQNQQKLKEHTLRLETKGETVIVR
jgi:hypothetical protein